MDLFRLEDLQELVGAEAPHCVSLFMPTHRAGAETRQDPIRFKNLLKQADARLRETGLRDVEAAEILKPAHDLLEDVLFWQQQGDGLALFLSGVYARAFRLPINFPELVVLNRRFHVKPLLQLLVADGRFYLLALSQNEVRLLHGTKQWVGTVELDTVPQSLADALKYEEQERQLQWHTGTAGRIGRRQAIFHGHGGAAEDQKDWIRRYFRQIDAGLQDLLRNERAPLLLAGVDYYFPIYREANSYRNLLEGGVHGNPERLRPHDLHARAWEILEPVFRRAQQDAAARFEEGLAKDRASKDLVAVVRASIEGRIDTLFAAADTQRWGHWDPGLGAVILRDVPEPGDDDLLDLATVETLRHAGAVYALPTDQVPGGEVIAATFRH